MLQTCGQRLSMLICGKKTPSARKLHAEHYVSKSRNLPEGVFEESQTGDLDRFYQKI